MDHTWQGLIPLLQVPEPMHRLHWMLAQATATPAPEVEVEPATGLQGFTDRIGLNLGDSLYNLVVALCILVAGLLIAAVLAAIARWLMGRTDLDNKLAARVMRSQPGTRPPQVEKWVGDAVFWLVVIFTIVAFLQALNLQAVSQPLNSFLEQILLFLPRLPGALILLGLAWLIATFVKLIVTQGLRTFGLDERLGDQVTDPVDTGDATFGAEPPRTIEPPREAPFSLSETIGNALYWFIFLLFLPSILNTLQLQGTLEPVQRLLDEILSILPNILAAVLIGAVGWFIAQVVRRIVTNLLAATGTDRIGTRIGLNRAAGGQSLSWIIGTIVYVLILIPTAIAALNALQIQAISGPAIVMLTQILNAIPQIFTAALILVLAYVIGRFVADLVTNILTSLGFNNIFYWLGLQTSPYTPPAPRMSDEIPVIQELGQVSPPTTPRTRTPSEVMGIVTLIGILLFATVAATNVLNFAALTAIVTGLLLVFGRILAGLVVFAIGLYLANLAFNLISSSGNAQARILAQTARIAIIAFVSAMALQQMGIAPNIVNLAFGLLLGAIAVAIALAFGLGGREIAAQQTREWLNSFKEKGNQR